MSGMDLLQYVLRPCLQAVGAVQCEGLVGCGSSILSKAMLKAFNPIIPCGGGVLKPILSILLLVILINGYNK